MAIRDKKIIIYKIGHLQYYTVYVSGSLTNTLAIRYSVSGLYLNGAE